ncbi:MAG TPA: hypothetical protein PK299_15565 [Anaerolineales bacterium]|nr:hypothetical protein [Anaerolineales bacterium]
MQALLALAGVVVAVAAVTGTANPLLLTQFARQTTYSIRQVCSPHLAFYSY